MESISDRNKEGENMKRFVFFSLFFVLLSGCSIGPEISLKDIIAIEGFIYDQDNNKLQNVKVETIKLGGSEHFNDKNKYQTANSDEFGKYSIGCGVGTTYKNDLFSKEIILVKYLNYIELKFSKEGYKDEIKIFQWSEDDVKRYVKREISISNSNSDVILTKIN